MNTSGGMPKRYPRLRPKNIGSTSSRSSVSSPLPSVSSSAALSPSDAKSSSPVQHNSFKEPSLDPYVGRLERFELFSTNQCYYIVGSNKSSTMYRIIKIDRTQIEMPVEKSSELALSKPRPSGVPTTGSADGGGGNQVDSPETSHKAKPTLRPLSEFVTEDPNVYSQDEIREMLDMIHDGNRIARKNSGPGKPSASHEGGGLKPIVKAYGVVGFIRFLDCYYLTLITKRAKVGSIGGNGIYTIKNTETIPLKPSEQSSLLSDELDPSSVLLSMWIKGKRSVGLGLSNREMSELRYQGLYQVVDLCKNFFFSYTYDLTRTLQENFLATTTKPFPPPPLKDIFAWNYFLTKEFATCLNSLTSFHWIMPIIHGAYNQRKIHDYGRSLNLVLIARRSRHFAGTRYLKRGVSEQGKVANDVEHEQILHDESTNGSSGCFSSFIQVRGSIPVYWVQESSMALPKPPIELNRVDPTYQATQLHFEDLFKRYGSPQLVLDLVKQSEKREREVRVGSEYRHAIQHLNSTISDPKHRIRMCALDYSHTSKHWQLDVSSSLGEVSTWAVNLTGFFCSRPTWKITKEGVVTPFAPEDIQASKELSEKLGVPVFPMEQSGVLRTNCIDCLDRTNVAQFSAGVEAISQQLVVMGIRSQSKLDPSSNIVRVLIDMYVDIGDSIALQYGGSEAHKKVNTGRSESNLIPIGKHKELLTSIRRYYSHSFSDRFKQDAMNLFLGHYVPYRHDIPLWELETDYYLHNFHTRSGQGTVFSMSSFQKAFGVEIISRAQSSGSVGDESSRIAKVQQQVQLQNATRSAWWQVALQANLQQRMWMKLGRLNQVESFLPSKYELLYQPDKIAQFDRFFARGWATPLRRSHSAAQHIDGTESQSEGALLTRAIHGGSMRPKAAESHAPKSLEVVHALPENGSTCLSSLTGYYDATHIQQGFLGGIDLSLGSLPSEYQQYCSGSAEFVHPLERANARAEFERRLQDCSLRADDVAGIRKLAESAYISDIIPDGPYCGLQKDHSAVQVETAIHEQFIGIEQSSLSSKKLIETELKRRGLDTLGVKENVHNRWTQFCASEKQYNEITARRSSSHTCSDLTTPASYQLYKSCFDESMNLLEPEVIFLSGQASSSQHSERLVDPYKQTTFAKKAARLGISVQPHHKAGTVATSPLFSLDLRKSTPAGFTQINDDLFCRKSNSFFVLNGAAMDTWHGTQPITKVFHLSDPKLK